MSAKKPDRFESMADEVMIVTDKWGLIVPQADVVKLFRAQHQAYVRLVKQLQGTDAQGWTGRQWVDRNALLAAMTRYRKGTR